MSTRAVLTVIGTVVGAYFNYPQLGAMAGAMIGSAVDPTTIQGPRINESAQQTVSEGLPRNVIFGTMQCTGNVIQRGPLIKQETSTSQGKGSSKIKGEIGLRTYAVGICEGEMAGLLRVWRNNKLVYDMMPGSGMVAESQKWIANKRFYTGSETQLPDPALELLDADAPAYRGSCYMVFEMDDVTDIQGAIPQYEFEVTRALATIPLTPINAAGDGSIGTFNGYISGPVPPGTPGGADWMVGQTTNNAGIPGAAGRLMNGNAYLAVWRLQSRGGMHMEAWLTYNGVKIYSQEVLLGDGEYIELKLQLNAEPDGVTPVDIGITAIEVSHGYFMISVNRLNTSETYFPISDTDPPPITYAPDNPYFGVVLDASGDLFSAGVLHFGFDDDTVWGPDEYVANLGQDAVLGDIVADIYSRCGVKAIKFDVSELTDQVRGYGLSSAGYTGADAIDALRMAYFFDKSVRDKKAYHPKRGKPVVKTITTNDLTQIPESTKRQQTAEIPYKLNVRYPNADSGYAVLKETTGSDSPDRRTTGEVTLDVPVSLSSDQAAQIADKQYKTMLAEVNGTVELSVMLDIGADLAEADCVAFNGERLRIEESEFADWSMKFTLKADRQSAYTSDVTGLPAPAPELPPSTIPGETELAIIDGSARTDSEDDISYLAAATGALPPWNGAVLERSLDGGANYTDVLEFNTRALMGVLLADISAASPYFTDTTNTVKIQLYREEAVIDALTSSQFLSRQGVFALENADGSWEYMQGKDVEEQSDGSFWLTTLHRGIANSGGSAHVAGAKFVWLADATYVPASSAWIGLALTHQATSFGDSSDDTTNDQTQTYVGRSQQEWAPAYLKLLRDGSNLITATWEGRGRFGNAFHPVMSRNFTGYRVTVTDGTTTTVTDTTSESYSGTWANPVTLSVVAINRITGASSATTGTV